MNPDVNMNPDIGENPEFSENPDIRVVRLADDMVSVVVRGALDAVTAPGAALLLHECLTGLRPHQRLVIDLRHLDFLAVAGARVLAGVARDCAARDVRCHLVAGPDDVARVILDRLDLRPPLPMVEDTAHIVAAGGRP